jgi:hypothetical protein
LLRLEDLKLLSMAKEEMGVKIKLKTR